MGVSTGMPSFHFVSFCFAVCLLFRCEVQIIKKTSENYKPARSKICPGLIEAAEGADAVDPETERRDDEANNCP